jgi:hypothetical protein
LSFSYFSLFLPTRKKKHNKKRKLGRTAEQPNRPTSQPPSRRLAELPNRRIATQTNNRTTEPPNRRTMYQPIDHTIKTMPHHINPDILTYRPHYQNNASSHQPTDHIKTSDKSSPHLRKSSKKDGLLFVPQMLRIYASCE